jgi:hypothetical protein
LNNKIVSTKSTITIFLAIVLVTGIIVLASPSFMIEVAQATSDRENDHDYNDDDKKSYGKDRDRDDKSKDSSSSSVSIKKVKCYNINVNLNGVDVDTGLPNGNGPISVAQEAEDDEEQESNSIKSDNDVSYDGSDGQSNSETNSRIVCINDNNNVVVGGGEEPIPGEPDLACEECFGANSALQTAISDFLVEFDGIFTFGFGRGETLLIAPGTDTIEQLCAQIESSAKLYGVPLSDVFIEFVLSFIFGEEFGALESGIDALIECLLEAGIIVEAEFPSIQISNNEIDDDSNGLIAGMKVDCSGDPMCKEIMRP